ncbi:magnesium transporter CorA, partial [Escherichia coli]
MLMFNNKMLKLQIRKLFPTRIASRYGMNFEFMTELKSGFGYSGAIIFMIRAGLT